MINLNQIAGLDIGFSTTKPTSGVGVYGSGQPALQRCFGGDHACAPILASGPHQVIAIDGPIIPRDQDADAPRLVERVFCKGMFQKRCKPGSSHVSGTGKQLRHEAGKAADRLAGAAPINSNTVNFPLVRDGAIVEAFPNAFLGVCLDDDTYAAIPKLKRGKKFDWLYGQWIRQKIVRTLPGLTAVEQDKFQKLFDETDDHELRAAVICILTAALTARNSFTAVGDEKGGWFFLPPLQSWAAWAKKAITENMEILNGKSESGLQLVVGEER